MCLFYFDTVLAQAFRQKRADLGLEGHRGAVVFDKAPQHTSSTFLNLRRNWSRRSNVLIVGADPECEVQFPAGFGAAGQPNDAWHMFLHTVRRARERASVDWHRNILLRKRLEACQIGGPHRRQDVTVHRFGRKPRNTRETRVADDCTLSEPVSVSPCLRPGSCGVIGHSCLLWDSRQRAVAKISTP